VKLQKATQCAVFALLELAHRPEMQVSAAEIAERYGLSSHHLAKVLRVLTRVGLVESVRGAGGGNRFCGNVKRTTLYDVISLFEDVARDRRSEAPGEASEIGRALDRVMSEIDETAVATLKSVTLATLLKITARGATSPQADVAPKAARESQKTARSAQPRGPASASRGHA